jgi:hypothetical protein
MSFTGAPLAEVYFMQTSDLRQQKGKPLTCNFLLAHAPEEPLYMGMHQLKPGCFYYHQINDVCCFK